MAYNSLQKLFYKDGSSERFDRNERLAAERLNADSTFRTGFMTPYGELFLAVPRELSLLNEKILRYERRISSGLSLLPPVAQSALIRGLVVDEVVSSSALEGVHSTRRQINDLLVDADDAGSSIDAGDVRRFREFATLYLGLSDKDQVFPTTSKDIRAIYDLVMHGEELGKNAPDGRLFRKGKVEIIGYGGRVLHEGLYPEEAIERGIDKMLEIVGSDEIPETYSAIVGHYIFEYVHPFYDGNGRTGRYLLALYLSRPLSLLTSLSLSRIIAENRNSYYRSFRDVEQKLNHGELTMFVINMLENVGIAQSELDARLTLNKVLLDSAEEALGRLKTADGLAEKEVDIIYQLVQLHLFAAFPEARVSEVARHLELGMQQTRRYLKRLEERGYLAKRSLRPLSFVLSEGMVGFFGLPAAER